MSFSHEQNLTPHPEELCESLKQLDEELGMLVLVRGLLSNYFPLFLYFATNCGSLLPLNISLEPQTPTSAMLAFVSLRCLCPWQCHHGLSILSKQEGCCFYVSLLDALPPCLQLAHSERIFFSPDTECCLAFMDYSTSD